MTRQRRIFITDCITRISLVKLVSFNSRISLVKFVSFNSRISLIKFVPFLLNVCLYAGDVILFDSSQKLNSTLTPTHCFSTMITLFLSNTYIHTYHNAYVLICINSTVFIMLFDTNIYIYIYIYIYIIIYI